MPERVSRVMRAVVNRPSVTAGRIRCSSVPRPEEGSRSNCTEKSRISMMPSQKVGSDWPNSATTVAM